MLLHPEVSGQFWPFEAAAEQIPPNFPGVKGSVTSVPCVCGGERREKREERREEKKKERARS
jgi:hypothetical protein